MGTPNVIVEDATPSWQLPGEFKRMGYRIEGDALVRNAKASVHQLRSPAGWAIQQALIESLPRDVAKIRIIEDESGKVYWCSVAKFLMESTEVERGAGPQLLLVLEQWSTEEAGEQPALF